MNKISFTESEVKPKKKKSKVYTELYVLVLDGNILTPDSFKEYWESYGATGGTLQGWRPPKKVYYTIGAARNGLRWVPKEIKDKVEIHCFVSKGKVEWSKLKEKT